MTTTEVAGDAELGRVHYWRVTGPGLAVAAVVVMLGVRFFLVISKYSINVFFYDQWDYLTPFFRHQPSIAELFFWQHGPHREGIGLIADKFLFPVTHWNARTDSFLIGGSIFAAMLLALRLKCKLFGALSYSDVAIPLIFLSLVQYETLVGTPNPAHSGLPLLLTMLYCLAVLGRNRLLRYSFILGLNFLLIYTGFGFFMGVVTVCVFLLECYWIRRHITSVPLAHALVGLSAAAASLASFFIDYKLWPATDCFEIPHHHWLQYFEFTALMFSAFVVPGRLYVSPAITVLGAAILLVAVSLLVWHLMHLLKGTRSGMHLIGAAMLSYCLLFATSTSIGRLCLGLNAAFTSRYSTLLIPAFLAMYFFLLSKPWRGKRNLVLTLWILLLVPAAMRTRRAELRGYANGKRDWANCYVRTENIYYCDQSANFRVYPHPEENDLQSKLDYLKQHHLNLFFEPNPK